MDSTLVRRMRFHCGRSLIIFQTKRKKMSLESLKDNHNICFGENKQGQRFSHSFTVSHSFFVHERMGKKEG